MAAARFTLKGVKIVGINYIDKKQEIADIVVEAEEEAIAALQAEVEAEKRREAINSPLTDSMKRVFNYHYGRVPNEKETGEDA